jgi:hypothetical protein
MDSLCPEGLSLAETLCCEPRRSCRPPACSPFPLSGPHLTRRAALTASRRTRGIGLILRTTIWWRAWRQPWYRYTSSFPLRSRKSRHVCLSRVTDAEYNDSDQYGIAAAWIRTSGGKDWSNWNEEPCPILRGELQRCIALRGKRNLNCTHREHISNSKVFCQSWEIATACIDCGVAPRPHGSECKARRISIRSIWKTY